MRHEGPQDRRSQTAAGFIAPGDGENLLCT